MAAPIIKLKRSAVEGKIPSTANVPLGELGLIPMTDICTLQKMSVLGLQ